MATKPAVKLQSLPPSIWFCESGTDHVYLALVQKPGQSRPVFTSTIQEDEAKAREHLGSEGNSVIVRVALAEIISNHVVFPAAAAEILQ